VGRLRVVLADDNYLVRQGVAALLREVDTIELVDTVDSLDGLLRSVEENHPDVVLTDIRMPPSFSDEGIIAAKRIRANYSDTGVLVLSQFVEQEYALELLSDGVAGLGYLLKERVSDIAVLVDAMRQVTEGECVIDATSSPVSCSANAPTPRSPASPPGTRDPRPDDRDSLQLGCHQRARHQRTNGRGSLRQLFRKLGLEPSPDVNRRVLAGLTLLRS
jgi:DNA-binding NarL/FixJ family response regulator